MGRFNPDKYDVLVDSSPDSEKLRVSPELVGALILTHTAGGCECGCGRQVKSKHSQFAMGHDIRLRGKLIRAQLSGVRVARVDQDQNTIEIYPPLLLAEKYNTASFNWAEAVRSSASKQQDSVQRKVERANRQLLAKSSGPQVGDQTVVKVGRWGYTGNVMAILEGGDELLVEYVTKSGDLRRARVAGGKVVGMD